MGMVKLQLAGRQVWGILHRLGHS